MSSPDLKETSSSVEGTIDKKELAVSQVERSSIDSTDDKDGELLAPNRRPAAERKLVRLLDARLLPAVILIYILNYIDVGITQLYRMDDF